MGNLLEIVGVVTGIIGTLTGVISLIWHLVKNKPLLKLERAHFTRHVKEGGFSTEGYDTVLVEIVLRNLGHRSTTIDGLWITYGVSQVPPFFEEVTILASSSKTLSYKLNFDEGELKKLFPDGEIKVGLNIIHTFGKIKREDKITLDTPWYNF